MKRSGRAAAAGLVVAAVIGLDVGAAAAGAPTTTTESVTDRTIPAFRANAACAELGYTSRLSLTFDRTVRRTQFSDGRLIEVTRIAGVISGGTGATAQFHAVRVFQIRPDGSEHEAGLSYQYRIAGTTVVISTSGRDDLTDAENFRPLCEALLT